MKTMQEGGRVYPVLPGLGHAAQAFSSAPLATWSEGELALCGPQKAVALNPDFTEAATGSSGSRPCSWGGPDASTCEPDLGQPPGQAPLLQGPDCTWWAEEA